MIMRRPVKGSLPKLVGVIASAADLRAAMEMKQLPDLFELRLDCLWPATTELEKKIPSLRAPLIITARAPREGGANDISLEKRRDLLLRFLPYAEYIDIELSASDELGVVLEHARKQKIRRILSYHNFKSTPSSRSLYAKARMAKRNRADIFKIATRTDTPAALGRLVDLVTSHAVKVPLSAMGVGRLGALSRLLLARCGSVLNFAALGRPNVEGQLSMALLRSALIDERTAKRRPFRAKRWQR
jgi:3-dehydroquinate dehydratase I